MKDVREASRRGTGAARRRISRDRRSGSEAVGAAADPREHGKRGGQALRVLDLEVGAMMAVMVAAVEEEGRLGTVLDGAARKNRAVLAAARSLKTGHVIASEHLRTGLDRQSAGAGVASKFVASPAFVTRHSTP